MLRCVYGLARFLKENLVQQLGWIRDEIRKIDTVSPTHINPKGFYGNLAPVGQDYFKEATVSDILGASIHPAWKFLWFSREEYGLAFSFCVDLIRSASRKKSFWVTELQAGPTITTGVQPWHAVSKGNNGMAVGCLRSRSKSRDLLDVASAHLRSGGRRMGHRIGPVTKSPSGCLPLPKSRPPA